MKKNRYIMIILAVFLLNACEVDYLKDPNKAEIPPSSGIINRVQKRFTDRTRDEWFSGRQVNAYVQYWNQVNYTEEDRYQYRETVNQNSWDDIYSLAQTLVQLIEQNVDEATKNDMLAYGSNETQIAVAQVVLVYFYQTATELWGDVPYYSYSSDNPTFQANQLITNQNTQPVYAKQTDIYDDMLKVLASAQAVFAKAKTDGVKVIEGDNFFNGDAGQWQKFANSLRLRIATRVGNAEHVADAIAKGVMDSNEDNAGVQYENTDDNAAPMYRAFYVDNRTDFAPSFSFVELLKGNSITGKTNPFEGLEDPRLNVYVAANSDGERLGIPLADNKPVQRFDHESLPGEAVLANTYKELYMEYSEVCFLISESKGFDDEWYRKGVKASMEKWGIDAATADAYIANLPAANQENVMTQKYIALYMQPMEAWSEYRRTGFPKTLVKPNDTYSYEYRYKDESGDWVTETTNYTFTPLPNEGLTDLPNRNKYLLNEANVNGVNVAAATESIGGDKQSTKMCFQK